MKQQTKQLPTGWEEVELSKVIKLRGGYAFKSEKFVEQGIPIIRISNFDNPYENHAPIKKCNALHQLQLNLFEALLKIL